MRSASLNHSLNGALCLAAALRVAGWQSAGMTPREIGEHAPRSGWTPISAGSASSPSWRRWSSPPLPRSARCRARVRPPAARPTAGAPARSRPLPRSAATRSSAGAGPGDARGRPDARSACRGSDRYGRLPAPGADGDPQRSGRLGRRRRRPPPSLRPAPPGRPTVSGPAPGLSLLRPTLCRPAGRGAGRIFERRAGVSRTDLMRDPSWTLALADPARRD